MLCMYSPAVGKNKTTATIGWFTNLAWTPYRNIILSAYGGRTAKNSTPWVSFATQPIVLKPNYWENPRSIATKRIPQKHAASTGARTAAHFPILLRIGGTAFLVLTRFVTFIILISYLLEGVHAPNHPQADSNFFRFV